MAIYQPLSVATSAISGVAAAGLTLDIAGALLLGLALYARTAGRAVEESLAAIGFNLELDLSKARETADAQVGALLLLAGFSVQLVADLGWRGGSTADAFYAVMAAAIVDVLAVVLLVRIWRRKHVRDMLLARLEHSPDLGDWWPICALYGRRLGVPPPSDIGIEVPMIDYFARVLGPARWARFAEGRSFPDVYTKLRRDLPGTDEWRDAHPEATDASADTAQGRAT